MIGKTITPKLHGGGLRPVAASPSAKSPAKSPEVLLTFEPGQIIFSKGDPGGDLFFIETGKVEIFIHNEKQPVVLAQMGAGEIVGVMTFLTKDTRLASARATETTTIKKISSQIVQRYIASFPKWLNIVLKEFVGRINEMNRMYSEASVALKTARELQITPLFLATQMAQSLAIIGKGLAKNPSAESYVSADDLAKNMQLVLNQPKDMIDGLTRVFVDAGLITQTTDPDKKHKAFTIGNLEKAAIFTQFVRESTQGATRKILKANLSKSEMDTVKAMATLSIKKGNPEDKTGNLRAQTLTTELSKQGVTFSLDELKRPAKLGLVVINGTGDDATVTFTPSTLLRTLACVDAIRRLSTREDGFEAMSDESETLEDVEPAA